MLFAFGIEFLNLETGICDQTFCVLKNQKSTLCFLNSQKELCFGESKWSCTCILAMICKNVFILEYMRTETIQNAALQWRTERDGVERRGNVET